MAGRRPIDTEPDEVFDAVFGPSADETFGGEADRLLGASGSEGPSGGEALPPVPDPALLGPDTIDVDMIDLEALDLPDEIDEEMWAESDPEHDGVGDAAGHVFGTPSGTIDLEALDLSDEIDKEMWAEADPEFGGVGDDMVLLPDDDDAGLDGPGADFGADSDSVDDDPVDDGLIDLEALDLPAEIDEAAWAAMEDESGALGGDGGDWHGAVFDAAAAEDLRSRWMADLEGGSVEFRLDLTDKAAVDAAGLAFLAAFARELKAAGGALTVIASGQVLEVLSLCGLDRRWPVTLEGE